MSNASDTPLVTRISSAETSSPFFFSLIEISSLSSGIPSEDE